MHKKTSPFGEGGLLAPVASRGRDFRLSLSEGAGLVASRVAWISGSEPPPNLSLRSFAYFVGSAGFPARHACRFGVLSASIYIPRLRAAAPSTQSRWRVTFQLRGGGFSAQPARGFGVIAHRLRSRGTSQPRRVRFPSPFVSLL